VCSLQCPVFFDKDGIYFLESFFLRENLRAFGLNKVVMIIPVSNE